MVYTPPSKTSNAGESSNVGEISRKRFERQLDAKAARAASAKATKLLNKKVEEPIINLSTRGIHRRFQKHGKLLSLKDVLHEDEKLHISKAGKEQLKSDHEAAAHETQMHSSKRRLAVTEKQWDDIVKEREENVLDAITDQDIKTIRKESGHIEDKD